MPKKRTYPKSAEAFNAFIRKHGLEDLSKLEERLEVGKGYLRYYVSKGTARLREISMFRLSALAGISGIDPDLAAGYKADVDYYGKTAEEKALDPRIVWITNLRKSLGMSRRAMSLAMALDVILPFATPSTFHGVAKHAIFAGVQRQRRSAPAEQGAQHL